LLLKAEEEARIQAEEEEEEVLRIKEAEEARLKAEEEARIQAEEEARLKAEEEARLEAEEDVKIREDEARLLKAEEEEARIKDGEEEALRIKDEEVRLNAEEEARIKAKGDEALRIEEEQKARLLETQGKDPARLDHDEGEALRQHEFIVEARETAVNMTEKDTYNMIEEETGVKPEKVSRSIAMDFLAVSNGDEDAKSIGEAEVFEPAVPQSPKNPILKAELAGRDQITERNSQSLANFDSSRIQDTKTIYEDSSRSVPEHLLSVHQPRNEDDGGSLGEVFDPPSPPLPKKSMVAAALKAKEQILERNSKSLSNFRSSQKNEMSSLYNQLSRSVPEHLMNANQPRNDPDEAGSLGEADVFDPPAPPPPKKPIMLAALKAKEQIVDRNSKSLANIGNVYGSDTRALNEDFSRSVPEHLMNVHQPQKGDNDSGSLGEVDVFDPPAPPRPTKPMVSAAMKAKEQIMERNSKSLANFGDPHAKDMTDLYEEFSRSAPEHLIGVAQSHNGNDDISASPKKHKGATMKVRVLDLERNLESEANLGSADTSLFSVEVLKSEAASRRKKKGVGFGNRFLLEARQLKESGSLSALNGSSGTFSQFDLQEKNQDPVPDDTVRTEESAEENPRVEADDGTRETSKAVTRGDEEAEAEDVSSCDSAELLPTEANGGTEVECVLSPVQKARLALENRVEQERVANSQPQNAVSITQAPNSASQARAAKWAKKAENKENTENKSDSTSMERTAVVTPTGTRGNLERMSWWRKNGKRLVGEKLGYIAPSKTIRPEPEVVDTVRRVDAVRQPLEDAAPATPNAEDEDNVSARSTVAIVESVKSVKEARLSLERRVREEASEQTKAQTPNATSSLRAAEWAKESTAIVDENDDVANDNVKSVTGDRLLWWRKNGKRLVDERRGVILDGSDSERDTQNPAHVGTEATVNANVETSEHGLTSMSLVEKRRKAAEARQRALQVRNGNSLESVHSSREPLKSNIDTTSKKEILAEKRKQVLEARRTAMPAASGDKSGETSRSEPSSIATKKSVPEASAEDKMKSDESITTEASTVVASGRSSGRTSPGEESATTASGTTATTEGTVVSGGRVAALAGKVESAAIAEERRMKRLAESERLAERTARARQARLAKERQLTIGTQQILLNKNGKTSPTAQSKEPRLSPIALAPTTTPAAAKPQQSSLIPHMVREADRLSGFICRYEHKLETLCKSLLAVAQQYENDPDAAAASNRPLPEMYKFVREREWYQRYAKGSSRPSMLFAGLKAEADRAQERRDFALSTVSKGASQQDLGGEKIYKVTAVGEAFLKMDGPVEADVCRFLSSVHNQGEGMTKTSLEKNWNDIARLSGDVQSERVRERLDDLMQFSLHARFIE